MGLMEVIFLPSLLFTHSLLMKRPVGCEYFLPLGAVSSTDRSAILLDTLNDLLNDTRTADVNASSCCGTGKLIDARLRTQRRPCWKTVLRS